MSARRVQASGALGAAARVACAAALAMSAGCGGCNGSGPRVTQGTEDVQVSADAGGREAPPCLLVSRGHGALGTVPIRSEQIASGLEVPWGLAFLPGGDVLVTERPGRVRMMRGGKLLPEPVATLSDVAGGEGGLLGIAAHPRFAETRLFYLYVTVSAAGGPRNRVERWKLGAPSGAGVPGASRVDIVVDDIPAARNHDGGRLRFGPDGMLYVGTGDGAKPELAQDPASKAGKLLRMTPDGAVPPDNPRPGSLVLLSGIRNTQGFDWLGPTRLVVSDHGPSGEYMGRRGHDEVNVAGPGDNLGWPTIYGCESGAGMVTPVVTWSDAMPPGGAAIYRGDAIPEWRGSVLVGSLLGEHLQRVVLGEDGRVTGHEVYLPGRHGRLREVIMGPDGRLYVTTSNCDGRGRCPAHKDEILVVTR